MCPELSPQKLAELSDLADFYTPRRQTDNSVDLAELAARRVQTKAARTSQRRSDPPLDGEVFLVKQRLLRFGRNAKVPRQHRRVTALGITRPPFFVALPMTTKGPNNSHSHFYRILLEDYEHSPSDDKRWPKWLYWRIEKVPLGEERRFLGSLRERTMMGVKEWLGKLWTKTNPRKRGS